MRTHCGTRLSPSYRPSPSPRQLHRHDSLYLHVNYGASGKHTKLTHSRSDFLSRGPSFTQPASVACAGIASDATNSLLMSVRFFRSHHPQEAVFAPDDGNPRAPWAAVALSALPSSAMARHRPTTSNGGCCSPRRSTHVRTAACEIFGDDCMNRACECVTESMEGRL